MKIRVHLDLLFAEDSHEQRFLQMIQMKCQALFSSKNINSAKVVIDVLRVKSSVADQEGVKGFPSYSLHPPPPPPPFLNILKMK